MNSVLAFHEVPDGPWFDDLVRWLQSRYRLLPAEYVSEVFSGGAIRNACHITVDDGHRTFYDVALPVLMRHRVPATLFVSPSVCAGKASFWFQELQGCDERAVRAEAAARLHVPRSTLSPFSTFSILKAMPLSDIESVLRQCRPSARQPSRPNVSVEELRVIAGTGMVSIGAHTLSHPILRNERDDRSEEEIVRSIADLSSLLGREVRYFAYPNGLPDIDFSEREETYLANAGVELAFSTESRGLRANDTRYRVPRIQISPNEPIGRIRTKLQFASAWNVAKKLRPRGEYAERQRLNRLLSKSSRRSRLQRLAEND